MGELEFQSFGEDRQSEIWERAHPILAKALDNTPTNAAGEPTATGKSSIRKAVEAERTRLVAGIE